MKPFQSYHICPFCGGRVQYDPSYLISCYICQECGYNGSFIIEVDTLEDIEKIKKHSKTHKYDDTTAGTNEVPAHNSQKESLIKKTLFKAGNYNVFGEEYHFDVSGEKYYIDQSGEKYKRCPHCLERLDASDKKCSLCGYDPNDKKIKWAPFLVIILGIFSIVLVLYSFYRGDEFHQIYDNISLILVLLCFFGLVIFVIYAVIIARK